MHSSKLLHDRVERAGRGDAVSELYILEGLLKIAKEQPAMRLEELYGKVAPPAVKRYVGDVNSIKAILFKLDQEGVVKNRIIQDKVVIDSVAGETYLYELTRLMRWICESSSSLEEFTERVFTCELNRYFLDANEVKVVYEQLKPPQLDVPVV